LSYNWPEIVKKKSIKELYDIVIGETPLCEEAELAAKKELINRGFSCEDPIKIKKQIELESLLEEQDFENSFIWPLLMKNRLSNTKIVALFLDMSSYFTLKKKKFRENWRQKRIKELKEEK
jgi:hypothetical protein